MPSQLPDAHVTLQLLLDAHRPFPSGQPMLLRILNDREISRTLSCETPTVRVALTFHDGPGDAYRILVQVDGYRLCGAFVHADPAQSRTIPMLMIPDHAVLSFPDWEALKAHEPAAAQLISSGVDEQEAASRYGALGRAKPLALASLMNLVAAMQQIGLGGQKTPLDFIREIVWDDTLAQDRFFAYAEASMIEFVQAAAAEGEFVEEKDPQVFHPGATLSFKQTQFAYSNVQITFHGNDTRTVDGVDCVKVEPDMDLFKEGIAHGLGEVLPNWITRDLTDPLSVLALRWMDAVQSDEPLFRPGYLLA